MQVRLPDKTLISVEPSVPGQDPDGQVVGAFFGGAAFWTWLRVNEGSWTLMARADFTALLIDVAKEARDWPEYQGYLIHEWYYYVCDPGMTIPPTPQLPYGLAAQ